MKRIILAMLIAMLIIVPVWSSGSEEAADDGTVTLTFMRTGTPEVLRGIFEPIIAEFEATHPGIKIDMQDLGWSDAERMLQTMAASRTLPDVMYNLPGTIFDLADKGLIRDLTPYLDEELINDMYPAMLDAGKYNGGQYMITCGGMTLMMWYNTELFEKAGLDPDNPPETWDELIAAAAAIDQLEGVDGIGLYGNATGGETSFVFESLFDSAYGGSAWDLESNRYVYDSPEGRDAAIKALALIQELVKYAQPSVVEYNRFDCRTLLRDGKVGIVLDGVNLANQVTEQMEAGTIKAALLPACPDGEVATAVNVGGWFIPENSEHPDEAWTFLRYLMQPENQFAHKAYGSVPILKSEAALSAGTEYDKVVEESTATAYAEGVCPQTTALWLATGEELQRLILGMTTPEQTLDNITAAHEKIYK